MTQPNAIEQALREALQPLADVYLTGHERSDDDALDGSFPLVRHVLVARAALAQPSAAVVNPDTISIPRELFERIEGTLQQTVATLDDEGDRVFLNSTNDVETLQELARDVTHQMHLIWLTEEAE